MIKLIIDSNKNLKKAATSKVFVGENEFEEITVSCNRRVLVNNIPDFSASLRVVIGENELSYPLAFSDTDSNTMTATVLIDTRMTRAVAELQFYVKFNSGEKVGMTNAIKIECKPNIESNGDEPYIPPIPLDDFVPRAQTIAGIDQYDAITAEELKAALDIEVSDGAKVFFEIFAPPYYVSDNDYCKIGDIWVDKEISTGQGYRVSVLMSKIYISDPGVYYCSWQPVVPASFNINVLPGGGNLPVHRYSETGGNTEYSYPPYRNGDILTVNGSDYECSVSDGSSYSSTYTYSFKRAVSEADITGKMSLIPINPTVEEIEAMPSGQLYSDENSHKGIIKGGQEFYDTTYIDGNYYTKEEANARYLVEGTPKTYLNGARLNNLQESEDFCLLGQLMINSSNEIYICVSKTAIPNSELFSYTFDRVEKAIKRVDSLTSQPDASKYPSALAVYNALQNKENTANKVTSLSSSSTDSQYPTAKCVYDMIGDIESLLAEV